MKIDVVVGNPPYNNDMYLDFVKEGSNLADKCSLWITPAKWQAKGGKQNENFRKNIVPYMSKIVYYPNEKDIFNIDLTGGVSYYLCSSNTVYDNKHIYSIIGGITKEFDSDLTFGLLNNDIIKKVSVYTKFKLSKIPKNLKWKVYINKLGGGSSPREVFRPYYIQENNENLTSNQLCWFSSNNKQEVESFVSFCYSSLVRYIVYLSLVSSYVFSDENWRFVPDPGAFDHIFTDEELYKKYNLTDGEIAIIESVIKERT